MILDLTPCSFGTEIRTEEPYDLFINVKDIHIRQQVLPKQGQISINLRGRISRYILTAVRSL